MRAARFFPRSTLALAVSLLAGCALQTPPPSAELQKEALPNASLPQQWKQPAEPGAVADQAFDSFNDAALAALIREALTYNADLRAGAARVEQAKGYVTVAGADLKPGVAAMAKGGGKWSGDYSGMENALIGATWEIDVWGRQRYGARAAADDYASAQLDYQYARQSLAAWVVRSWLLAVQTTQQESLLQEMVQSASKLVEMTQQRLKSGIGDEQDVAQAQASLGETRDRLRQVQFARTQALRALEVLLGRYPGADIQTAARLPAMPAPVPAGLPAELLARRPDVVAAERRVAASFNRTEEARVAHLPKISLTATFGAVSSDLIVLQNKDNPTTGLGGTLLWPIFTGGALDAQVDIRTAEQQQAVAQYAAVGLRAFDEVEGALASETALRERQAILDQVARDSRRSMELATVQYKVGINDLRGVLQEQMRLYNALMTLVQVQGDRLAQRVNLHLALGGGFGDEAANTAGETGATPSPAGPSPTVPAS
ncbi:efflux transporter outer membrane subunit [Thiobacillus sp.]|uniref:efflux transporter outer membrane subunit n=1 Tax=Thiobacillus sp. TaxID=924 RepID=UPI0025E8C90C|nr:TolC family protein [Thiobacillus sp.]MBT9539926.1 TolC family protein [Thiobacillus sp.]